MMPSVVRHRRSSRLIWIGVAVTAALLLSGGTVVYLRSGVAAQPGGCTGERLTLTVAAAPDHSAIIGRLAEQWTAKKPVVDQRCVVVAVRAAPSSAVAAALGPAWDDQRDGPRPDVWAPDSSAWLLVAAGRPDAGALLPGGPPVSLATSPVVLAMQRPMAQAMGWPQRPIGWTDLAGAFAGEQTWARFNHPEWGAFRLGMVEPTRAVAGMGAVLSFLDADNDGTMNNQELFAGLTLSQMAIATADDSGALLRPFKETGAAQRAATTLPAAFPVLERDLAEYASTKPAVELAPVYPKEGTTFADYPYAVLRAPWVDQPRQKAAADFLAYLRTSTGRDEYTKAGFRDASRATTETLMIDTKRGFQRSVAVPVRTPTADTLGQLLGMWSVLQRPNNLLLTLDTSGSMKDPVPGTGQSRLELIKKAALQGAALLNNQTTVGLWEFSSELTSTTDFRELVPPGLANERLGQGNRRQAILGAIQALQPNKGTGLYDTVYAAYLRMQAAWQPNSQNILVVFTDGRNEDDVGMSLPELITALRRVARPDRPLPIIGLAVGPEADAAVLQEICAATAGRAFVARNEVNAIQQIVLAFAGRLA